MIIAQGITKSFNDTIAVSSLDFQVKRGEIFGIVGPDGAGKSTLLRLIATIIKPDRGSIVIGGIDFRDNPFLIKENLAYMPQRFGLYEDLTVEENIFFFGRLFGISPGEIRKKLTRLYDFSQLGPFSNRLAGKLSGGMKQKLGLACCLVHAPGLIILDEPTNGVDPVSRREFWKILYDLLSEGVTIVVSTAYLDEAERCNRIALMHGGRFIRLGQPRSIKEEIDKRVIDISVSDARGGEMALGKAGGFSPVIRTGNALRVFVSDPQRAARMIRSLLSREKIEVLDLREVVPSLEDCFLDIISREAAS
jgi:ABC-2 type transport system ATP-binding protein